jgi:hypothetical protein
VLDIPKVAAIAHAAGIPLLIDNTFATPYLSRPIALGADIHRTAGEIALKSPAPDAAKAQAYFERALAIARKQQAKSLELARGDEHGAASPRSGQAE